MDAPHGSGGNDEVPGSFKNPARPERLPERDVELTSGRPAAYQPCHY